MWKRVGKKRKGSLKHLKLFIKFFVDLLYLISFLCVQWKYEEAGIYSLVYNFPRLGVL